MGQLVETNRFESTNRPHLVTVDIVRADSALCTTDDMVECSTYHWTLDPRALGIVATQGPGCLSAIVAKVGISHTNPQKTDTIARSRSPRLMIYRQARVRHSQPKLDSAERSEPLLPRQINLVRLMWVRRAIRWRWYGYRQRNAVKLSVRWSV